MYYGITLHSKGASDIPSDLTASFSMHTSQVEPWNSISSLMWLPDFLVVSAFTLRFSICHGYCCTEQDRNTRKAVYYLYYKARHSSHIESSNSSHHTHLKPCYRASESNILSSTATAPPDRRYKCYVLTSKLYVRSCKL